MEINFQKLYSSIENENFCRKIGQVTDVAGQLVIGHLPGATIGSICKIITKSGSSCQAEVVGIRDNKVLMLPYSQISGIGFDSQIILRGNAVTNKVGPELLGRVINGMGEPIDGKGTLKCTESVHLQKMELNPLERETIKQPLDIGVRAINGFTTVGRGQRVAIMAGSGVGKSVLMGMMARSTQADVNVIALIGERGREVKDFIEEVLGEEGLKKSVVVAVTNDQSPLVRLRGAYLATSIAEFFSRDNKDVLLIMDSLTRFAMAQREVGLNIGEPPTTKGYTPSLYPTLSKLLERAGNFENSGSITGIYTVLVEGDDMDDPVADTVRSIVDGHIVLSRALAEQGQYPAIDVLQSISRVMNKITDPNHQRAAMELRRMLALYRESEDLINVGAYKQGTSSDIDRSMACYRDLKNYFRQELNDKSSFEETINELLTIFLRHNNGDL